VFTIVWIPPETERKYTKDYLNYLASKITIKSATECDREKEKSENHI
jgi:hypothetical protein